jgi:hypothetical protein
MKQYKFFTIIGALALAAGFTSCGDDDEYYDYPGVSGQVVLAPTLNESYTFSSVPGVGVIAPDVTWNVSPRSRVKATEDLTVKFEIDNSLIDAYNAENNTEYVALPDGIVTLATTESTIATGRTSAEEGVSLKVTDNDNVLSQVKVGTDYILPIRMTTVTKGSAKIAVSSSNVSYLTFNVVEKFLKSDGTPKGTLVTDHSNWTVTYGGGASEWYGWDGPIAGNSINYGRYNSGSYVIVDMKREYTFDGIYAYPYYYEYGYTTYAMLRNAAEVSVSSDGNTWNTLGAIEDGNKAILAFYAPVTARYYKIEYTTSGYVAVSDISVYAIGE